MILASLFLSLLIIAGVVALGLAAYALRQGAVPGTRYFSLMLCGEAIWAFGYWCEIVAPSLEAKIFWDNVQFTGSDLMTASALLFAVAFASRSALRSRWAWLMAIFPAVSTVVIWTDSLHGWLRPTATVDRAGAFPTLVYTYGPWFWTYVAYGLAMHLIAIGMIFAVALQARGFRQVAAVAALLGVSAPLIGALLTISGRVPILAMNHLDVAPIAFTIANPIWAWALLRGRLFELVPVAHKRLVELLPDGVIVADERRRVVAANAVARRLLADPQDGLVGRSLDGLLAGLGPPVPGAEPRLLTLGQGEARIVVEASLAPLHSRRGRMRGWLLVLRDITARHEAERALREQEELFRLTFDRSPIGASIVGLDFRFRRVNDQLCAITGYSREELLSRDFPAITHPDDLAADMRAARRMLAREIDGYALEKRYLRKDGSVVWIHLTARLVADNAGAPRYVLALIQDVTVRKQAEQALYRRISELAMLNEAAGALASWRRLPDALAVVGNLLRRHFGADAVAIWQRDERRGTWAQLLALPPGCLGETSTAENELLQRLGAERRLVVAVAGTMLEAAAAIVAGPANAAVLALPLDARGQLIGALAIRAGQGAHRFAEPDLALAQTVAGMLTSAVENARLAREAEEAAVGRERSRLARELHDSVSQALFAADLTARTLPQLWELDPEEGRAALSYLARFTSVALTEMRALLIELRPQKLIDSPLHETLRSLAQAAVAQREIEIVSSFTPVPILPPEVQVALYRVTQEALNNVSKHAAASRVSVSIVVEPPYEVEHDWEGEVRITVADNGRGISGSAAVDRMGMTTMRERAAEIAAELKVTSAPGRGTTVSVVWRGAARVPELAPAGLRDEDH